MKQEIRFEIAKEFASFGDIERIVERARTERVAAWVYRTGQ